MTELWSAVLFGYVRLFDKTVQAKLPQLVVSMEGADRLNGMAAFGGHLAAQCPNARAKLPLAPDGDGASRKRTLPAAA